MSERLLQCQGITRRFSLAADEVPVLRGLDLEVREGEQIAILGASGSGNQTIVADGASVMLDFGGSINEDFTLTGVGNGDGALTVGNDNVDIGGNITLAGDAMIGVSEDEAATPSIIGDISLGCGRNAVATPRCSS